MTVLAQHVATECPRCGREVSYSIGFEQSLGWYLIPEGRAETKYGYIWLAHRVDLRELALDVLAFIRMNFPKGASRKEIVNAIVEQFDLIPEHAEALLEYMKAEGYLYEPRLGMVVLA